MAVTRNRDNGELTLLEAPVKKKTTANHRTLIAPAGNVVVEIKNKKDYIPGTAAEIPPQKAGVFVEDNKTGRFRRESGKDEPDLSAIDAYFAKLARACIQDPHIIDTIETTGQASAFVRAILDAHAAKSAERESKSTLPDRAPAFWATDKQAGDSPPDFIRRVYMPWIGKGLTRPGLKQLDIQLYVALSNWLRKNDMPADLDLPTLKEANDRLAAQLEAGIRPAYGELSAREASRLNGVIQRRRSTQRE